MPLLKIRVSPPSEISGQACTSGLCSGLAGNGEGVPPLRYRSERMKKQRKHDTREEKVAILRRHLLDKEPTSKLCDELGLQPTVFYHWQKESR